MCIRDRATHNYIIKKKDLLALEKAGIVYFNDSVVEYYSNLSKHLGSCSRYQLLGSLFANQEIKNMENRIPAIQGKMGGYTYYSFSIEPEKLLKVGYVLHRNEANQNMMPTYQRIIKKARLKSVQMCIRDRYYTILTDTDHLYHAVKVKKMLMDGIIRPHDVINMMIAIYDCRDNEKMSLVYKEIISEEVTKILNGIQNEMCIRDRQRSMFREQSLKIL